MSPSSDQPASGCHGSASVVVASAHRSSPPVGAGRQARLPAEQRRRRGDRDGPGVRIVLDVAEHSSQARLVVSGGQQREQLLLAVGELAHLAQRREAGIGAQLCMGLRQGACASPPPAAGEQLVEEPVDRAMGPAEPLGLPFAADLLDAQPQRARDETLRTGGRLHAHSDTHRAGSASTLAARSRIAYVWLGRPAGGMNSIVSPLSVQ